MSYSLHRVINFSFAKMYNKELFVLKQFSFFFLLLTNIYSKQHNFGESGAYKRLELNLFTGKVVA